MNARQIKKELKEAGIETKDIRVRCDYNSITVDVKTPYVCLDAVKEVVCKHEVIRRCVATGEILGGANTYVSVFYVVPTIYEELKEMVVKEEQELEKTLQRPYVYSDLTAKAVEIVIEKTGYAPALVELASKKQYVVV